MPSKRQLEDVDMAPSGGADGFRLKAQLFSTKRCTWALASKSGDSKQVAVHHIVAPTGLPVKIFPFLSAPYAFLSFLGGFAISILSSFRSATRGWWASYLSKPRSAAPDCPGRRSFSFFRCAGCRQATVARPRGKRAQINCS